MYKEFPDFAKEDLDLLSEQRSGETMRYRRGLVLVSFAVLGAAYLGKTPSDLNIGLWNVDASDQVRIAALTLLVLTYWSVMYVGWVIRDGGVDSLRRELVEADLARMRERRNQLKEKIERMRDKGQSSLMPEWTSEEGSLSKKLQGIEEWQERERVSRNLNILLGKVERWFPLLLVALSVVHVIRGWMM